MTRPLVLLLALCVGLIVRALFVVALIDRAVDSPMSALPRRLVALATVVANVASGFYGYLWWRDDLRRDFFAAGLLLWASSALLDLYKHIARADARREG